MNRNTRDPLFDLMCMAYLPATALPRTPSPPALGEEAFEMARPARPGPPFRLKAAIVAMIAMVAVAGAVQIQP